MKGQVDSINLQKAQLNLLVKVEEGQTQDHHAIHKQATRSKVINIIKTYHNN